jgi:undecaprenyl-diphosphatase UppP
VGLYLKKLIEGPFTKNLWVIATMMIVVGVLLTIAELVGKRSRDMNQLGIGDALAVGSAQVLALIPGSSRSGSTIMGGLFAGLNRETAARFSFLLSIPAIAASGLLELKEAMEKLPAGSYGFRRSRLCLDLVPVAISADAFDRSVYSVSCDCRRANPRGLVVRLYLGEYLGDNNE